MSYHRRTTRRTTFKPSLESLDARNLLAVLTFPNTLVPSFTATYKGNSGPVSGGDFKGTLDGTTVAASYCIDIVDKLDMNSYSDASATSNGVVYGAAVPNAGAIAWLIRNLGPAATTPEEQDGLQAAIWRIEYGNDFQFNGVDNNDGYLDENIVVAPIYVADLAALGTQTAPISGAVWISPGANSDGSRAQGLVGVDVGYSYVSAVYKNVLGRTADSAGLAAWSAQLDSGLPRSVFVQQIDHSAEYFATIITPAYAHYLGRIPDNTGMSFWISEMQNGLSDEQLEASFIGSAEFYQTSGGTAKGWVDAMYRDLLGRSPDSAGEAFWIQGLDQGASRAGVAYGFAVSTEREGQRITGDYQKYLGRLPDVSGLSYWLDQFANHGQINENLITGFAASNEYFYVHAGG
jgi:hypothetical protein